MVNTNLHECVYSCVLICMNMSCFWRAIDSKMTKADWAFFGSPCAVYWNEHRTHNSALCFINWCKVMCSEERWHHNFSDVVWQGGELDVKFCQESIRDVLDYDETTQDGHFTSSCDPFLLCLCQFLKFDIIHNFAGNKIYYRNKLDCRRVVEFKSTKSHMHLWFVWITLRDLLVNWFHS